MYNQALFEEGRNVKVSKEQVRENRMRVVETASELFRERGYDGIGISELMSEAGRVKHFGSGRFTV